MTAGHARGDWARALRSADRDHYQRFCRSACRRCLAVPGRPRSLRAACLPGHRDAAGIYLAYGHAGVGVNGLVTNPAATGYMLTQTGTLKLDAYSAVRSTGRITAQAGGISTRSRRRHAVHGERNHAIRANCQPTATGSSLRWRRAIRCHVPFSAQVLCSNRRADHLAARDI